MKIVCTILLAGALTDGNCQPQYSNLQRCKVEDTDDSVLCGTYAVFENHKTKQGRRLTSTLL